MPHGPKASDNFLGGVPSGLELSFAAICGKVSAAAGSSIARQGAWRTCTAVHVHESATL